ncbi:MAG TPA: GNAT family N-acetyltransferase [Flavobacteriales bacterium]|nr:GNAT family N-acetyltransferase [Flavobacteriales bacterium]
MAIPVNGYIYRALQGHFEHINIRLAAKTDMADIARIYNQAIDLGYVTADTEHVTAESRREVWETITAKQGRPFWVARDYNSTVAFFYFRNFYDRPAYRITAEIGIYIDANYRGKGLGQFILNYAMSQAPILGLENVLALIFASNKNSIGLFEKNGFEKRGDFPGLAKSDNGYNDLIILLKKIQ